MSELAAIFTTRKFPSGQTGFFFLALTLKTFAVPVNRREQKQLAYLQLHISLASHGYELGKKYLETRWTVLMTQEISTSEA